MNALENIIRVLDSPSNFRTKEATIREIIEKAKTLTVEQEELLKSLKILEPTSTKDLNYKLGHWLKLRQYILQPNKAVEEIHGIIEMTHTDYSRPRNNEELTAQSAIYEISKLLKEIEGEK